jgi:hypothetical protein
MDYSNLCLIFSEYWHVSNGLLARVKKWSTLTLSSENEKNPIH